MSNFNRNVVNNYLNLTEQKRYFYATSVSERMMEIMREHNYTVKEQESMFYLMFNVLCTAEGRKLQQFDYKVFCYAFQIDTTFDEFSRRSIEKYNPTNVNIAFAFAEKLGVDFQKEYLALALCLFTCDGTLSAGEEAFIEKYFRYDL